MIAAFRKGLDSFFGRGAHGTSVPVMDGPLQPNHALDRAQVLLEQDGVDNLVQWDGALAFSSRSRLMRVSEGASSEVAGFESEISCLAADGGALAVGLEGAGVVIHAGKHAGTRIDSLRCATSMVFDGPDALVVTVGAEGLLPSQWKHDLMRHGATGSVWRVSLPDGKAQQLASGLAWPCGVALSDGVVVTEAWSHRLVKLGQGPVLANLPGYPSRLGRADHGGWWLSVFAPRNQLVEFVLRERSFLRDMTAGVAPEYWIAPSLSSKGDFREPLQGGAVKQMGILKPWAPAWSYGLVVKLDDDFQPVASWHSRADGTRHGVTATCEAGGMLAVAAKGAGQILLLDEHTITGEAV